MAARAQKVEAALRRRIPALCAFFLVSCGHRPEATQTRDVSSRLTAASTASSQATRVDMHNVLLRKGPNFKVRIAWLRGYLRPTRPRTPLSLDDVTSFDIQVEAGVLGASLDELNGFLSKSTIASPALTDLKLSTANGEIKLNGIFHKGVPLPIEVAGGLSANPDGRLRIHMRNVSLLKVPVKGLLKAFNLKTADLLNEKGRHGIEVEGDDVLLDASQILPPPHLKGLLKEVNINGGEVLEVYGDGRQQVTAREQWRNFMRLRGGGIEFGKLFMRDSDLIMIDTSNDNWFDLDLENYQQQVVYGYARLTPGAGMQIFMPDVGKLPPGGKAPSANMDWVKHREWTPPAEVLVR